MPLVPANEMMKKALAGSYAVGYFESWNMESLLAVIDAAEESRSPVIIGTNGGMMADPPSPVREDWIRISAGAGQAAADAATVPCAFIFNECKNLAAVRAAVCQGFNIIMPIADDDGDTPAFRAAVKDLVSYAHDNGVAVEGELGVLPCDISGEWQENGERTDADQAREFVAKTGVDLLAVSVGNMHMSLHDRHALDLDKVGELYEAAGVPLVLHGGTGIDDDSLNASISRGIAKVNFGTIQKQCYLAAVREALDTDQENPHDLLGHGGDADVLEAGRAAVRDVVREKMEILNCCGKA